MLITNANLEALRVAFKTSFQQAFDQVETYHTRVATTVPSTSGANIYGWLKDLPGMREWIGQRVIKSVGENAYTLQNKPFENTIGVKRDNIEDDELGQYDMLFAMMGETAAQHPDKLVFDALAKGFESECFDGQAYFDADHPTTTKDGKETTYSNIITGSEVPWFFMKAKGKIKPLIYQQRKKAEFVSMDKPTDEPVFNRKEFVYGVDTREAAGYSFPQLAIGAKTALDATSLKEARTMLREMKGDQGRVLNVAGDTLVVPPELEDTARELLLAERNAAGATNTLQGTAELLVVPYLTA